MPLVEAIGDFSPQPGVHSPADSTLAAMDAAGRLCDELMPEPSLPLRRSPQQIRQAEDLVSPPFSPRLRRGKPINYRQLHNQGRVLSTSPRAYDPFDFDL